MAGERAPSARGSGLSRSPAACRLDLLLDRTDLLDQYPRWSRSTAGAARQAGAPDRAAASQTPACRRGFPLIGSLAQTYPAARSLVSTGGTARFNATRLHRAGAATSAPPSSSAPGPSRRSARRAPCPPAPSRCATGWRLRGDPSFRSPWARSAAASASSRRRRREVYLGRACQASNESGDAAVARPSFSRATSGSPADVVERRLLDQRLEFVGTHFLRAVGLDRDRDAPHRRPALCRASQGR